MQGKGIRRNGHLTADDSFERQFFDSQFIGKGSSGKTGNIRKRARGKDNVGRDERKTGALPRERELTGGTGG